jgi:UMF1 family MFS transporter
VGPGAVVLAAVLIILSNFGFASGESFVSSFLPELGPPEDLGKISGYAWSLGYFGGLASTALVIFGLGPAAAENMENLRWVGPVTAVFFALSAIPTFLLLKERGQARPRPSGASYLSIGCERLGRTLRELGDFRDLLTFLISLFFAMAGLSIVIAFAFIYGDQVIGWDARTQMLMFILTQLSAAGGALGFGWLQDRMGSKRTFDLTLILWVVSVTLIYGTEAVTASLNDLLGTRWQSQHVFLAAGCLAGCGLGATQSASRALVGLFTPASKSGEFFGFWGLAGKLASVVGILALGALQSQVGLERSILLCSLFFLLALGVNLLVDERRGRARAMEHQGE